MSGRGSSSGIKKKSGAARGGGGGGWSKSLPTPVAPAKAPQLTGSEQDVREATQIRNQIMRGVVETALYRNDAGYQMSPEWYSAYRNGKEAMAKQAESWAQQQTHGNKSLLSEKRQSAAKTYQRLHERATSLNTAIAKLPTSAKWWKDTSNQTAVKNHFDAVFRQGKTTSIWAKQIGL